MSRFFMGCDVKKTKVLCRPCTRYMTYKALKKQGIEPVLTASLIIATPHSQQNTSVCWLICLLQSLMNIRHLKLKAIAMVQKQSCIVSQKCSAI